MQLQDAQILTVMTMIQSKNSKSTNGLPRHPASEGVNGTKPFAIAGDLGCVHIRIGQIRTFGDVECIGLVTMSEFVIMNIMS